MTRRKFDYGRSRATATRMLDRYGQPGQIRRTSVTGGNAWDPNSGTTTSADHCATVFVTEFDQDDVDGSLILATDKKVLVSTDGLEIEPKTSDALVIGERAYEIVRVMPLAPAGTLVMWTVQARG